MEQIIREQMSAWGVPVSAEQAAKLTAFSRLLLEKNKVMNLTSITEQTEIARKHMLDSLFLLTLSELNGPIIDIGSGAGFPGLPLKLVRPELDITFLDATGKRMAFVAESAQALGCPVKTVHARAEEYVNTPGVRESFSCALSRAVAPLNILCELVLPYIRIGGLFFAMKSDNAAAAEELDASQNAIKALGGTVMRKVPYQIDGIDPRQIIIIKKQISTPKLYPRRFGKITSKPL